MGARAQKYWNPFIETLPREKLNLIQVRNFRNIFSYAKVHSALYREKLRGIEPNEIKTIEDIRKIPLLGKSSACL